jgi:hypothetical protein
MNAIGTKRVGRRARARAGMVLPLMLGAALLSGGCGMNMSMMHGGEERPPAEEFGFGPRSSESGLFQVSLDPVEPIRVGRMQAMRLEVRDATGQALDGAAILVDGGMPQHGHGLPTRPRVTRNHGGGIYDVEGMKFNMGGWWVVAFRIDSAAGTDSVVFNLEL